MGGRTPSPTWSLLPVSSLLALRGASGWRGLDSAHFRLGVSPIPACSTLPVCPSPPNPPPPIPLRPLPVGEPSLGFTSGVVTHRSSLSVPFPNAWEPLPVGTQSHCVPLPVSVPLTWRLLPPLGGLTSGSAHPFGSTFVSKPSPPTKPTSGWAPAHRGATSGGALITESLPVKVPGRTLPTSGRTSHPEEPLSIPPPLPFMPHRT